MSDHPLFAGTRPLTDEEVSFFLANGWMHAPALVSESDVAQMLVEAKRLMGDDPAQFQSREQDFSNRRVAHWVGYHGIAEESELFGQVVHSGALGRNMQRLLRRDVGVKLQAEHLACKLPDDGTGRRGAAETFWHQDFPAYPHDRMGSAVFWIALEDLPPERGVMRFRSRSHLLGTLGRVWRDEVGQTSDPYLAMLPWLDEECPVSPPLSLKAGDATVHYCTTIHSAPANTTAQNRWAYLINLMAADIRYTGAYGTDTPDASHFEPVIGDRYDDVHFPLITSHPKAPVGV